MSRTDPRDMKCECAGCRLAELLRETVANGFPPDLLVPMVLDVLEDVVEEYGVHLTSKVYETTDTMH